MEIDVSKLEVTDNKERKRFEVELDEYERAYIEYRKHGDEYILVHTEVPQQYGGMGVANRLATLTMELLQKEGATVASITCPFLSKWIKRHPEYDTLMAGPEHKQERDRDV
jgi:predicted GNAT family acetyltransferase